MEEKDRTIRIGTLKEQLTNAENYTQKLQQAMQQNQIDIISLRSRIDEYENKRWEVKDDKKD
jgi:predicted  nucleic acid-binding Zn-ribbon protein